MDLHPLPVSQPDRAAALPHQRATSSGSAPSGPLLLLAWSVLTVGWALTWATGALPHPFADARSVMVGAVFNAAPPMVGIAFTLVLGTVSTLTAVSLLRPRSERRRSPAVEWLGWLLVLAMVATLLHGKVLPPLGYTPVILVLGWFDTSLVAAYLDALRDPELHVQFHVLAGVVLWAHRSVIQRRARRDTCPACGRQHGWTEPQEMAARRAALRRGRAAVMLASAAALVYPAIRLPWLIGRPIGMDAATFAEVEATPGARSVGVALGVAAVVGVVLMYGLVRDWGVRFPRWLPGVAGRRVPVRLAVVPAAIVTLALVAMGRGFLTALVTGQLAGFAATDGAHVLAFGAMLPWGLALGVATVAYAERRRDRCQSCHQGRPEQVPSVIAAGDGPA